MEVGKFVTNKWMYMWLILVLVPIVAPIAPSIEGKLLPVTTRLNIVDSRVSNGMTTMYVEFTKRRDCRFLGLTWYQDETRLPVFFLDDGDDSDMSRPPGDQIAGPWMVGTEDISGTVVRVSHRCHPFWETHTVIFP